MSFIARAFVLSLVATGLIASNHTASTSSRMTVSSKTSAMPIASCPPDDPDACGIR